MLKKPNKSLPRIGVDLLGSDVPARQLLEALLPSLKEVADTIDLTLFATDDVFAVVSCPSSIKCCVVSEMITMEEDPLSAIRRKKDSSLIVGIDKLRQFELDAFVTAGNTGALLGAATLSLPLLTGIERPALLALIPTKGEPIAVVDVGANITVKAENLFQFALMGIAFQKARDIPNPTVGLLNIGAEAQKGTAELRKAYHLLQQLNLSNEPVFAGNIEGRDVFHGEIQVLVTDGFTGNVFLKTAEGIAAFVLEQMDNLGAIESLPILKNLIQTLRHRLHYAEYPGAILCGVDGIIVKCHGASSPKAFASSIKGAARLVKHFFLEKIKHELNEYAGNPPKH